MVLAVFYEETLEEYIAIHPLCREGEGVVGFEDAAGYADGFPLHIVFREAVGGEAITVLHDHTGVFEAVGRVHLHDEGLAEGGLIAFEFGTCGRDDFAVEVLLA